MFRFVARRIPRFRLSTLCASMLLFVTFVGAWRHGRSPDAKENDALVALQEEGLRFRASRVSGARPEGLPAWSILENPIQRLANWIAGNSDPLEQIHVQGWPSDATREKLLDLPRLNELRLQPNDDPAPIRGPNSLPPAEETLGRRLPKLPEPKALPDAPPPLPRGTPLGDEERIDVAGDIVAEWSGAPEFPAKRFLCHAHQSDVDDYTYVLAVDGASSWLLTQYEQGMREAVALFELDTADYSVRRMRGAEGWRTGAFSRDRGPYSSNLKYTLPVRAPYLDWTMERFFEGDFETLYESAERLDDGALLLRMRPRSVSGFASSGPCELDRGILIVEPENEFAVRRIEADVVGQAPEGTISLCYILEYEKSDGLYLPTRCQTWVELPPKSLTGYPVGGKRTYELRYAWEIDPELPKDLFSPTRGGAEFLAPRRTTTFHWWYFTGALSLAWFYLIASDRVRQRWRRVKKPADDARSAPLEEATKA